jgi:5-methyltetrahydrofolate--homocysteine methyltransferase
VNCFDDIQKALIDCEPERAVSLVKRAVADNVPAGDILNKGLLAGMDVVGELMENEEMFIPEVLDSADAMSECVAILKPMLGDEDRGVSKTILMGTVQGDLHDIGKNLVSMMMEIAGMEIHDVGVDVAPETFVEKILEIKPDIVGLSALLTTTMPMVKDTVDAIVEAGIRDEVKILVGGAPLSQEFADEIGADAFAPDAIVAARVAKSL